MATVIEKMSNEIRDAFAGRTPLIMAETFEIGLAERAALASGVIEFTEKTVCKADMQYYRLIEDNLTLYRKSENFSTSYEDLNILSEKGCTVLEDMPNTPPVQPKLIIIDILPGIDKTRYNDIIESLRRYIRAYETCFDDYAPIRSSLVIMTGDSSLLPEDIIDYTKIINVPYPDFVEIRSLIPSDDDNCKNDIAYRLAGFSLLQAQSCINKMSRLNVLDNSEHRNSVILEQKLQILKRHGSLLNLYEPKKKKSHEKNDIGKIGGMENLKEYIKKIKKDLSSGEISITPSGVGHYKGILLVGVPGCGKSHVAHVLQDELGITMLRLDMERMMHSYVGQSEKALEKALEQAEAMCPCLLWIDELDKGMSGATGESGDGGTFKRMFGQLLKWLSEKQSPCFIYATANDLTGFPQELFRSGRFDAVFGAFMPTAAECKQILISQMKKAEEKRINDSKEIGKKPPCDLFEKGCTDENVLNSMLLTAVNPVPKNYKGMPKKPKFMTGADIEKIVKEARNKIGDNNGKPISATQWADTLSEVVADPFIITEGYSNANLDKITACYVKILRSKFIPTSNNPLFDHEKYDSAANTNGVCTALYKGDCPSTHEYDIALFDEIMKRLPAIATKTEQNAFLKACQ